MIFFSEVCGGGGGGGGELHCLVKEEAKREKKEGTSYIEIPSWFQCPGARD